MAGSGIPTYDPRIQVTLLKNVRREFISGSDGLGGSVPASGRFKSVDRSIDLTPYLGEAGGVTVTKSTRAPAGAFVITLADKMFQGATAQMESLYGIIEPMDVVEIRIARKPSEYGTLPIVMRGFVSSVRRSQVIGNDGKPQRAITISGQDYGKLWQIIQIRYYANYVMGQQLLSFMKFAQNYGVNSDKFFSPSEFMYEVTQKVFNNFTSIMRRDGSEDGEEDPFSPVSDIGIFDLTVSDGRISPLGVNAWDGGTLYDLMTYYGDVGPWNELFIEDRESGPALVYRPNPFKTPSGDFIQQQGVVFSPSTGVSDSQGVRSVSITDEDIVADNVGRSDQNLANYYMVSAPSYVLNDMSALVIQDAQSRPDLYYLKDYRNSAPWLYGIRNMDLQTRQGLRIDGKSETELNSERGEVIAWLDSRRKALVENNRDNVVFEDGSLVLKGNERLMAGSYLTVTRGSLVCEYYVPTIEHSYMPFRQFTTVAQVERGTGFIARAQRGRGRQSPYLAEANNSGVYK